MNRLLFHHFEMDARQQSHPERQSGFRATRQQSHKNAGWLLSRQKPSSMACCCR